MILKYMIWKEIKKVQESHTGSLTLSQLSKVVFETCKMPEADITENPTEFALIINIEQCKSHAKLGDLVLFLYHTLFFGITCIIDMGKMGHIVVGRQYKTLQKAETPKKKNKFLKGLKKVLNLDNN